MTAPNRNVLWANALVDELVAAGVDAVVVSPGSRSTPLTVAAAGHEELRVFSQLDERSAAYFALGRARRTGRVTPLICTSGTAAANYHPAVMEASEARVPLLALTADRPPELRDSGANQTADQEKLYGDAVRFYKDLPEPAANDRALRSLRTTVARAVAAAEGADQGPVHLNVPFKKPLEPTPVPGDVPDDLPEAAERGRDGPYVDVTHGAPEPGDDELRALAIELGEADRGLIVAGPADPPGIDPEAVTALAHATGFPVLADPLSGLRYGGHTRVAPVIGSYDAYLSADLAGGGAGGGDGDPGAGAADGWTDPELVVRLGASPTSKRLRKYLAGTGADQYQVDPAGRWREAEFAATDLVVAEPTRLCARLSRLVAGGSGDPDWRAQWEEADRVAEAVHARESDAVRDGDADEHGFHEGDAVRAVADGLPDPATLFVSNSMPVRDLNRFVGPSTANVTALGNRGVSGIDGIVSSALGAGSGTTDDLTLVVGDLALYHDSNGLLAVERCDADATIVAVNNDGGGIFHELPIEEFEPPFTESFVTPHGLDFEPLADLHGLDYARIDARPDALADRGETPAERSGAVADEVAAAVSRAHETAGSHLIDIETDAGASHRSRERLAAAVGRAVHGDADK
ncbi:2-succinyl-5-enolpyruvyl-6-hydroxy-3-cyclohexene-1-carboxylic-acid synthase [Halorubrum sp. GN11_10-6_MGM]|uniref:2-succinyl-5-enolpyruvyl-6-hydroxy-3- cyclohexene-1-carboxylic-acid synthase n=1 Tax=Halorubrum sp. GN11_10-6_MGM TaxID=2518112 RepID=UPI0010F8A296|nr:2-succinyl-5-enolpyruvyl-6-hydroxy-3-cyclohexene-1-carboxylic-acid synthase [Halorubrum sp. GN11_10-6_MGM]TKX75235.1 2-succinyl-5-enolpyruvyl-6-hydroxy-3-cyclohexene-1-carboxylic-acid synthase [Halorubrum sp. GN11_10-6_MGM]